MYQESIQAVKGAANKKLALLHQNPLGYFLLSCLAGMYIGFGILLSFTVSGQLQGLPATKLIMGLCFGVALSLVIIAGAELFTESVASATDAKQPTASKKARNRIIGKFIKKMDPVTLRVPG